MNGNNNLYWYEDTIELVLTPSAFYLDNRPMNNRKLTAHKGVNNEIFFNVRNRDRKLQNLYADRVVAYLINPNTGRRALTRDLEHGSEVGKLTLTLSEADLANLNPGLYQMYLTKGDTESLDVPLYIDQNNNIRFDIEITDQVGVEPIPTQTTTSFIQTGNTIIGDTANTFVTSALYGNQERNFNKAQHTIAVYPAAYTGQVIVQASCLSGVPQSDDESKDWFNVTTLDLSNASSIAYSSFNVNCNWVRILSLPESGSIDKVELRN